MQFLGHIDSMHVLASYQVSNILCRYGGVQDSSPRRANLPNSHARAWRRAR